MTREKFINLPPCSLLRPWHCGVYNRATRPPGEIVGALQAQVEGITAQIVELVNIDAIAPVGHNLVQEGTLGVRAGIVRTCERQLGATFTTAAYARLLPMMTSFTNLISSEFISMLFSSMSKSKSDKLMSS